MRSIQQPVEAAPDSGSSLIRWMVRGFFFAALVLVLLKTALPISGLDKALWPGALLIIAATVSTLASLTAQMPLQNVLLASVVIGFVGAVAQAIGAATGLLPGSFFFVEIPGPNFLSALPGGILFAWILSLLSSRGIAQLILRPWRRTSAFGFWQLGLTVVLALPFHLGLEIFASQANGNWQWQSELSASRLFASPLVPFAAWGATALMALVSATPALLKKKPVEPPPAYDPLVIWFSLNLLFETILARQPWPAAIGCLAVVIAALVLAIRGARFQN
jgi:hypothetical protein